MRIGVGLATSADTRQAAIDAATDAAEPLDGQVPNLAVVFASPHHVADARSLLTAVHDVAAPTALIGCVVDGIVSGHREVESEPSVTVWLAALPEPPATYHMEFVRTSSGGVFAGQDFGHPADAFHLLLADPYTFPVDVMLDHLNANRPGTTVMGGMVSGGFGPGCLLFRDDEVLDSGAVGVTLPGWRGVRVVSQGCQPIGPPYTVTASRGQVITELGGRPPLDRLREIIADLPPTEQRAAVHGPQVGIQVDEYLEVAERGDFLIRPIIGVDDQSGAIEVGDMVEVGTTVRFQMRDAASAHDDLRSALQKARAGASGRPAGALLFTCNGRGRRMFDVPDHDAALIHEELGGIPLAGFFAAGELGPIGGRNALHGFTASLALFVDQ